MRPQPIINAIALIILLSLGGCLANQSATATSDPESSSGIARNEPYFPTKFTDLEIPGELQQVPSKSLFINTDSFTGGILNFAGRVEVSSLSDFFVNSMQKNGWKLAGEFHYNNILLAFSKSHKSCMITIYPGDFPIKTKVYIYITSDSQVNASEQNL